MITDTANINPALSILVKAGRNTDNGRLLLSLYPLIVSDEDPFISHKQKFRSQVRIELFHLRKLKCYLSKGAIRFHQIENLFDTSLRPFTGIQLFIICTYGPASRRCFIRFPSKSKELSRKLDTLILSACEKFEPLALRKNISLDFALPDSLSAPYACDRERIEQVLWILLDNALSYTPENGRVCLTLTETSDWLCIRVEDNGPGIPDSEKEAIFDRFYRCDRSHKDKEHFGLGLSIAREIVRMHKGKIWAEDTPGGGASFVVLLKKMIGICPAPSQMRQQSHKN